MRSSAESPIGYSIDQIRAVKEEKIRLTPPLFCKIAPEVKGFSVINSTLLNGPVRLDNGRPQFVVLDDLLIYLTTTSSRFHFMQLFMNATNSSSLSFIPRTTYQLSGSYQLADTAPFTTLHQLSSTNHFLATKDDPNVLYLFKVIKSTNDRDIFWNFNSLNIDIQLIDILGDWLTQERQGQITNYFSGIDLSKYQESLRKKIVNISTGETGKMFAKIKNEAIISITEDG